MLGETWYIFADIHIIKIWRKKICFWKTIGKNKKYWIEFFFFPLYSEARGRSELHRRTHILAYKLKLISMQSDSKKTSLIKKKKKSLSSNSYIYEHWNSSHNSIFQIQYHIFFIRQFSKRNNKVTKFMLKNKAKNNKK